MSAATASLPGAPDPWVPGRMPARRRQPPYHMTDMILAEPDLAVRIVDRLAATDGPAARLAAEVRRAAGDRRPILIVGCGTSEHAAQAVAAILRAALGSAGLPAAAGEGGVPIALQAFESALGDTLGGPGSLVIGISHEGGTRATNRALERAQAAGATVAIITVSDRSPGAAIADLVVITDEMDQSWCHTVAYLSPIVAAAVVGAHLTGEALDRDRLAMLLASALGQAAIAQTEAMAAILAASDRLVVVGSGLDRPAARELVLKLEEGAHLPATMRELETMFHGHLAGIDARNGLVLLLVDETALPERAARAAALLRAARVLGLPAAAIVTEAAAASLEVGLTPAGRLIVPLEPALPPAVRAIIGSALPLQLLVERLARSRGVDPDTLRRDEAPYRRAAEAAR